MKKTGFKKIAAVAATAALAALCAFVATGGSQNSEEEKTPEALTSDTGLTGGVAATVNGVEISEDTVTRRINNMRMNYGYTEDDEWKKYLSTYSETPEKVRTEIIDYLVDQELVKQCADQLGITTDDEEIQSYVDKMRENYSSDEAWETALQGAGFDTVDDYKDELRYSILNKKIQEQLQGQQESAITNKDLIEYIEQNSSTYSGAKRTSHILFGNDDEELAQQVHDQIVNGEISFEDAVAQYSTDEASKENDGDVGWDKLASLDSDYQSALADLAVGSYSDPVKTKFGYHIILVTDEWTAPSVIESVKEVPEDILTQFRENYLDTKTSEALEAWLDQMREAEDVVVNDAPEGLPYWVEMDADESSDSTEATDEAEAVDEAVSDEAAAAAAGEAELEQEAEASE